MNRGLQKLLSFCLFYSSLIPRQFYPVRERGDGFDFLSIGTQIRRSGGL